MTGTRYFWNAINKTEAHFSYRIDYTTPSITIKGGTEAVDARERLEQVGHQELRGHQQRPRDDPPAKCDAITVANVIPAPGAAITQPYKGQFIPLHVVTAQ